MQLASMLLLTLLMLLTPCSVVNFMAVVNTSYSVSTALIASVCCVNFKGSVSFSIGIPQWLEEHFNTNTVVSGTNVVNTACCSYLRSVVVEC